MWITLSQETWPMICKFYSREKQSALPCDCSYDADYKAIFYSLEGAICSFPFSGIPEIGRLLAEYPKLEV